MSVANHCRRNPETARPDESIRDAAKRMDLKDVGCLVIVDGHNRPTAVVTDRDVVIRGVSHGLSMDESISSIASPLEAKAREATPVARALVRMGTAGVRRMPVIDSRGRLTGMFSHDDALQCVAGNLSLAAEAIASQFAAGTAEPAAPEAHAWEIPTARQYRNEPVALHADASIFELVSEMEEHGTGSVVIVGEQRQPVGIVTDRDVMRRVAAAGADPGSGTAGDVMTKDVVTVHEDASIREVLECAKSHKIRRIPLVGSGGALTGIVSLDDVVAELSIELGHLANAVRHEMRAFHRRSLERR